LIFDGGTIFNDYSSLRRCVGCSRRVSLTFGHHNGLVRYCLQPLSQLFDALFTLLQSLVELLVDEDVVLVGVLQICVLLLQGFEIVASTQKFLLEPLDAVLKFLSILPLVEGGTVLQRRRRPGRALPVVTIRDGDTTARALNTALTEVVMATRNLVAHLLEHLVGEILSHFVLEN